MAHIRKRKLPSGKIRWQVTWDLPKAAGCNRARHATEMFTSEREAKAKKAAVEISRPTSSALFRAMAEDYFDHMQLLVDAGERERSYIDMLRGHINNHILTDTELAGTRCASLGTPECQLFLNRLIVRIGSKPAAKVRTTLSQIFKYGTQVGYVAANPVRDAEVKRKRRPEAGHEAPFILPTKAVLKALINGAASFDATGRAIAVVRVLMFCGLRMSELRGLPRSSCHLVGDKPHLSIAQRADRYNVIGSVKSTAGRREVDLGPDTAQALRLWLVRAPVAPAPKVRPGEPPPPPPPQYAFPNEDGGIWAYPSFRAWFWVLLMNHCGLTTDEMADAHIRSCSRSHAALRAPAFGPHMLRHVYASLQIEQGVSPKRLQKLIGHATLKMTLDTYGHLWPDEDADRARARGVERMI